MVETKKDLILLLNKLKRCSSDALVRDILKIILVNKKHQDKIFSTVKGVGLKKENENKINNVIESLKNIPYVHVKNGGSVIYYKTRSLGCEHCINDLGCTLRITTQCNRNCFFCFADNSPITVKSKPEIFLLKNTIRRRLKEIEFKSFAISGGEPFLYPEAVFKMLEYVNGFGEGRIYTRIYTNGDLINEDILKRLGKLGLNEIRYSIKPLEDPDISLLKASKKYISKVLIEMPVLPNSESFMKNLICKLDEIGIDGINLLELFFNGYHIDDFTKRKYKVDLDRKGIRKIYDAKPIYEYPIYGSRILCLRLIKYFADVKAGIFINFCSQETKQLQYDKKIQRAAIKSKPVHSSITDKNTHEILAIYSNIKNAENKLLHRGIKNFYIRKNKGKIQRMETSVKYLKHFLGKDYLLVKIYRDPSCAYDVDFELLNIKQERQINRNVHKLIAGFIDYAI